MGKHVDLQMGDVFANGHVNGFSGAVLVMIRTAENPEFSTSLSEGRKKRFSAVRIVILTFGHSVADLSFALGGKSFRRLFHLLVVFGQSALARFLVE